jgi:UDP-galactose-lipid carrier transferase
MCSRSIEILLSKTVGSRESSLAVPKSHDGVEAMADLGVEAGARRAMRVSPIICAVSILAADIIAIGLATVIVLCGATLVTGGSAVTAIASGAAGFHDVVILFAATVTYLAIKGRYNERIPFWSEMKLVLSASFWAVLAEALVAALNKDLIAHFPTILTMMLFPVIATVGNAIAKYLLVQAGAWQLSVVLVGGGEIALAAEAALASDPGLGYSVVGRVDPQALLVRQGGPRLWPLLHRFQAGRIIFALDGDRALQRQLIEGALRERVPFAIAPEAHAFPAFGWEATRFFTHDVVMLSFRHGMSRHLSQMIKAIIDVSAAAVLLLLASPIFLLVALMNIGSGGPIFFAHRRIGIGGKKFYCLKFRTMAVDSDRILKDALARDPVLAAEWEGSQKLRSDPRVTSIGRFLRKTSLDELPQLINVLLRHMSLVGPRPIVESEVRFYGDDIAHYYNTRPGVTGLWQVSGRSNTSYKRRVQLDVWYVNNWTVWLDVAVLLKTLPAVLGRSGAH